MNARPPGRVTLIWCPVCGRDDRWTQLKTGARRHLSGGVRCPGDPQKVEYVLPATPAPSVVSTVPPTGGTHRVAVAVEVAIRPALPHLGAEPISFVGRVHTLSASHVEDITQLVGLALREMAATLPDAIGPHPRPEPDMRMPRAAAPPPAGWIY